ncbi:MAG: hypothetical protein J0I06_07515 [Planctomycetes bacterium]|nr:hypothetical protein [Planctomycetota bacterium]
MDEGPSAAGGLVVPAARVRVSGEAVRIGPARPVGAPEPKIQVFHENDAIRMIQVVCTCGERICIRCEY